jgi:hypothetical protein
MMIVVIVKPGWTVRHGDNSALHCGREFVLAFFAASVTPLLDVEEG